MKSVRRGERSLEEEARRVDVGVGEHGEALGRVGETDRAPQPPELILVGPHERADPGDRVRGAAGSDQPVEREQRQPTLGTGAFDVGLRRTGVEQETVQVGSHAAIVSRRRGPAARLIGSCESVASRRWSGRRRNLRRATRPSASRGRSGLRSSAAGRSPCSSPWWRSQPSSNGTCTRTGCSPASRSTASRRAGTTRSTVYDGVARLGVTARAIADPGQDR